jgi:hypothetical protein
MMQKIGHSLAVLAMALVLAGATAASADPFSFSTGEPDGRMATASRPESHGKIETESADDFILESETHLDRASFTGLLFHGGPGEIRQVRVEIYRVFPKDSDTTRPIHVPTRMNSPSDVAFDTRDSADGTLRFTVTVLGHDSAAANSVIDGIHPSPEQATKGDGPVEGHEVRVDVVLDPPFDLPADHYFFVPQVRLKVGEATSSGCQRHVRRSRSLGICRCGSATQIWIRTGCAWAPTSSTTRRLRRSTVAFP